MRQEADQNVGQHPIFFLVPDGADAQIAFVNSERCFRFGQFHVRFPAFLIAPVGHVAAQQTTILAQLRPISPSFNLLPDKFAASVVAFADIDVEQPGRA